jgi:phage terminase large subunit
MSAVIADDPFAAVYAAMCAPTPGTRLADALLAATSQAGRDALYDAAPPAIRDEALRYLATPSALRESTRRLAWLRADPARLRAILAYYRDAPADFISDWSFATDPRLLAEGKDASVPFTLWPAQRNLVAFIVDQWRNGKPGTLVKSRDVGASVCAMSLLGTLAIFNPGFVAIVGSAKEDKVDSTHDQNTLFAKLRNFLARLPPEFNGGWVEGKHSAHMRCSLPNGSAITGEAGDGIGRGGRASIVILDEAAHIPRSDMIEKSLAATSPCIIAMSSVYGTGGNFYARAHNADIPRFDLTWRDDPRKNFPGSTWYEDQCKLLSPETVAQEIDCNFNSSAEDVVIKSEWIAAAVGLNEFLGVEPSGQWCAGFDVADRGADMNCVAIRHGCELVHVEVWSGKNSDITASTQRACDIVDKFGLNEMIYDGDGLGGGVHAAGRTINENRTALDARGRPKGFRMKFDAYRGGMPPIFPERNVPGTTSKAKDFYSNTKAQGHWDLARRFQEAFKARNGRPFDKDNYISINPAIGNIGKLIDEIGQPTYEKNGAGKIVVCKTPDGHASPNRSDATVMCFATRNRPMHISDETLRNFGDVYFE